MLLATPAYVEAADLIPIVCLGYIFLVCMNISKYLPC